VKNIVTAFEELKTEVAGGADAEAAVNAADEKIAAAVSTLTDEVQPAAPITVRKGHNLGTHK
jgi:hypothetical protein